MNFKPFVYLGVLIGSIATNANSLGQSSSVAVDEYGSCPVEGVLRSFPKVTQPSAGIGVILTKLPGATLERDVSGNQTIGTGLLFNTQLIVYGLSGDQKKVFVRTIPKPGASATCGWISSEKVLLPREKTFQDRYKSPQPLQMRDISRTQQISQNLLNVKAVVHDLSISGDSKGGIDIFEDPSTGHSTEKIRLFDAFLVFDQLALPATDSKEETRYWLIGEQVGSANKTLLKGWIRQRDVVIWPSRLAVQWNEEATVSGYPTPDSLDKKVGQITLPERLELVDYPEQITRRLPVLEQFPSPESVFEALPPGESMEDRKKIANSMVRYYKIATPGRACLKEKEDDCISARQVDVQREKIANAESSILRMDILILIDATESMDPYLAAAVHTIEHLVHETESDQIRQRYDLRFAISLYGDYPSNEADYTKVDFLEIVQFFRPTPGLLGTKGAMATLVNNPKSLILKDMQKDKLEAPFAAVIRAAKTANWRPLKEVPLRFIVHIGDSGSRDPGKTSAETQQGRYPNAIENKSSPPQSTLRERYGEEAVAKALRDASVIYIPLGIEDGTFSKPAPNMWNKIFRDQTDKIIALLSTDAPIKNTMVTHIEQGHSDAIERQVGEAVLRILGAVEARIAYEKCDKGSKSDKCVALQSEEKIKTPEVVKLVDRVTSVAAGLSSAEINNIYSREQSIVTMYSPARSIEGKEMFTHWVALDNKEFGLLADLLDALCQNMSDQDSKNPVMKALRDFSEMYSNEDFSDLTVREILGKRLGIPNLERTDFSGRTRDEIDDAYRAWQLGENRKTWDTWHLRACKAAKFTQLMRDDKKIDSDKIKCDLTSNSCDAPEEAQRVFRWKVQVSQDAPTYYVPLDVLP
jgi:hypothetical protein